MNQTINICVGKYNNKEFPEVAKIEVESLDNYLQTKELIRLVREKTKDPKAVMIKTIFVSKDNNLFVYLR